MIELLKLLKWDLQSSSVRFSYFFSIIRNLPGSFGIEVRRRFFKRYLRSVGKNLRIYPGVRIRNVHKLTLGDNVRMGEGVFIQAAGEVIIGNHVGLGPDVKIWSANHAYEDPNIPVLKQGLRYRKVVIGNDVWAGANVFILPGAEIGEGVIIGAASVVEGKPVPAYTVLAGNPARPIGSRIID